jgi:hypothetical protein
MNHMRRSGAVIALLSTGLLVLAVVTPAAAGIGEAKSEAVTWTAQKGINPRISSFAVTDGRRVPDSKPRNSSTDDGGWYTLTRPDGTLTIEVVSCVRVGSDWAEFAGVVTVASGVYVVGEVFLVSVKDGGPNGVGDEIGMKSHGLLSQDPYALKKGCYAALDDKQFGRQGVIVEGDIAVY